MPASEAIGARIAPPEATGFRDVGWRLTKDTAHVFGWNSALKLVTIVASIILARMLGPSALGLWALVTSTSGWIWILGELGLGTAVIPVVTQERVKGHVGAEGTALRLGLLTGLVTAGGYGVLAPFFASSVYRVPEAQLLFVLSAATFLPLAVSNILSAILQAYRRIKRLALMGLATGILNALGLVAGAALGGLTGAFVAALVAGMLSAVAYVALFRIGFRETPRLLRGFDVRIARQLVDLGALTMASTFLSLVGSWIALTILAQTAPVDQVGFYNVAWRASAFVTMPASAIFVAFFPLASESYTANPTLFDRTFRETMRYSLMVTFPITAMFALLAREVVTILYGFEYAPAAGLLAVLAGAGFLQAFSGWGSTLFYVSKSMRRGLAVVAIAVALQVASAAILIPLWGVMGLVLATLVLTFVIVGTSPVFLRGKLSGSDLRVYSLRTISLAAGLVALGWFARNADLAVRAGILIVLLLAFAVILRGVVLTPADRRFIRDIFRTMIHRD